MKTDTEKLAMILTVIDGGGYADLEDVIVSIIQTGELPEKDDEL